MFQPFAGLSVKNTISTRTPGRRCAISERIGSSEESSCVSVVSAPCGERRQIQHGVGRPGGQHVGGASGQ